MMIKIQYIKTNSKSTLGRKSVECIHIRRLRNQFKEVKKRMSVLKNLVEENRIIKSRNSRQKMENRKQGYSRED